MPSTLTEDSRPTLAYLMTDVAGSTRLWESDGVEMARAVARLDEVAIERSSAPEALC